MGAEISHLSLQAMPVLSKSPKVLSSASQTSAGMTISCRLVKIQITGPLPPESLIQQVGVRAPKPVFQTSPQVMWKLQVWDHTGTGASAGPQDDEEKRVWTSVTAQQRQTVPSGTRTSMQPRQQATLSPWSTSINEQHSQRVSAEHLPGVLRERAKGTGL